MAFWIVFFYRPWNMITFWLKVSVLSILLLGIFLTFSRSSIIGLIFSTIVYMFFFMKLSSVFNIKNFLLLILLLPIIVYFIYRFNIDLVLILIFDFFWERMFSLLTLSEAKSVELLNFSDPESSEGYRLFLIDKIINYSSLNILGSGFLGIWIILDGFIGSAHGQYNDVLFRTGFLDYYCIFICFQRFGFFKTS